MSGWNDAQDAAGHVRYICVERHDDGGWLCSTCAGDLYACTRCGEAEGGLADVCPGAPSDSNTA